MKLLSDVLPDSLMTNLEKYVSTVEDASREFTKAISLLNNVRIGEARVSFTRTIKLLDESGALKSSIEEEIANLSLDPGLKEELLYLIDMFDDISDSLKESAREFTIIPFLELPERLRNGILRLSEKVVKSMNLLANTLKFFIAGRYKEVEKAFSEILKVEEEADALELENRSLILELSEKIKPYALQLLAYHLINQLESTTDLCARVAERVRLISMAWLT
ncbi:MAG: DUF47 family protein [Candidatus Aenigmatarchaeota archaeon]